MPTYTKTTWVNGVAPTGYLVDGVPATISATGATEGTPTNATNMNHIEQGIYDAQETANSALAANLTLAQIGNFFLPVGCCYGPTAISANPSTYLLFGTWVAEFTGRVPVGVGTSDATYTAGSTGGESNHTLTVPEMPSHYHTQNANEPVEYNVSGTGVWLAQAEITTETGYAGGGTAHNNMPPFKVLYWWRRTA